MTRCMLHEKELPKKIWSKATNTLVYLLNRMSTSALHKRTSFEAWFGYKPDLQH
jgi:predicted cupin superfamily sugar epimerase